MGEITAITPQVKDKTRCNIFVDGRFYCGLTLEAAMKNRLKAGQTVDPATLSKIQMESEKSTAFDKALNFISAAQKTEKQVREYLAGKGYLPAVADYVMEKMREYGFLDDGGYAQSYASSAVRRKGVRLIKMELKAKGVAEGHIEAAVEKLRHHGNEIYLGVTPDTQRYYINPVRNEEGELLGYFERFELNLQK